MAFDGADDPETEWCARFDRVVNDVRAALLWSATARGLRTGAGF
jgi:hypothetical protein